MSSSRCLVSLLVNVCTLGCAHANILPIHCFILAVQISPASRRDEVNQGGHPQQDPTGFRCNSMKEPVGTPLHGRTA
eukprot:5124724-Pyramimonas_sp.AAC.1